LHCDYEFSVIPLIARGYKTQAHKRLLTFILCAGYFVGEEDGQFLPLLFQPPLFRRPLTSFQHRTPSPMQTKLDSASQFCHASDSAAVAVMNFTDVDARALTSFVCCLSMLLYGCSYFVNFNSFKTVTFQNVGPPKAAIGCRIPITFTKIPRRTCGFGRNIDDPERLWTPIIYISGIAAAFRQHRRHGLATRFCRCCAATSSARTICQASGGRPVRLRNADPASACHATPTSRQANITSHSPSTMTHGSSHC